MRSSASSVCLTRVVVDGQPGIELAALQDVIERMRDGQPYAAASHGTTTTFVPDAAALAAVKRWRFLPAKRGERAVESRVLVPIEFELTA